MQVVISLAPGGTERLVLEICRRIAPEFDTAVCCLDEPGAWASELAAEGIPVIALGRRAGFHPNLGRRIAKAAEDVGAQLLHCHQYSPFVYGRIAKMVRPSLGLVYTEHGRLSDAPPSWKRRLINPLLSKFEGSIVAVSHELREYMATARFPESRVQVIHNGVDASSAPSVAQRARARRALGLDGAFVAVTAGRLDPVKDFGTLFDAFARVRRSLPNARLLVIGDGPERERLTARAERDDLRGGVHMVGYRSDVRDLLLAADLFVNSSISEGISITILEAMAAGLPVVATDVGGNPEVVCGGLTGMLVPRRHPERLADAIFALAVNDARRLALGTAGRQRVEAVFTINRMVDQYAQLYRQTIG
jgi:glycosyltransferase involved in cell wall biosynthesis